MQHYSNTIYTQMYNSRNDLYGRVSKCRLHVHSHNTHSDTHLGTNSK